MPKAKQQRIYIAVFDHRHGIDLCPVLADSPDALPSVASLFPEHDPERGDEYLSWRGPYEVEGVKDAKS